MKKFCALIPFLFAVVLFAADDKNPPPNQPPPPQATDKDKDNLAKDEHSKGPKEESLSYRQRMVFGTVKDVKDIDVKAEGKTENHMLAKLEMHDKQMIVIDLGPRGGLKSEVKAGDEIAAFGIAGRLHQKPLIVASKIATIVPIEGRDQIFEAVPASYSTEQNKMENERLQQDGRHDQGSNTNINSSSSERIADDRNRPIEQNTNVNVNTNPDERERFSREERRSDKSRPLPNNSNERFSRDESFRGEQPINTTVDRTDRFQQEQVRGTTEQNPNSNAQFSQEAIRRSNEGQFDRSANYDSSQPVNYGPQGVRSDCCECQNR